MAEDKSDTLKLTFGGKAGMAAYFDGGTNCGNITATSTLNAISDISGHNHKGLLSGSVILVDSYAF